jgi:hypothetical protein
MKEIGMTYKHVELAGGDHGTVKRINLTPEKSGEHYSVSIFWIVSK